MEKQKEDLEALGNRKESKATTDKDLMKKAFANQ
jgi:hypothetical protein